MASQKYAIDLFSCLAPATRTEKMFVLWISAQFEWHAAIFIFFIFSLWSDTFEVSSSGAIGGIRH